MFRELDTSTAMSGPHVFAVRLKRFRQRRRPRPPHPRPALMTLRNAHLSGTGWREFTSDLGQTASSNSEKQKLFLAGCKGPLQAGLSCTVIVALRSRPAENPGALRRQIRLEGFP